MNFFTVRWVILPKGASFRTRRMGSLNVTCDMQVNYAFVSTFGNPTAEKKLGVSTFGKEKLI
jgi:hypothetical protein